jgi:hypothetical protein
MPQLIWFTMTFSLTQLGSDVGVALGLSGSLKVNGDHKGAAFVALRSSSQPSAASAPWHRAGPHAAYPLQRRRLRSTCPLPHRRGRPFHSSAGTLQRRASTSELLPQMRLRSPIVAAAPGISRLNLPDAQAQVLRVSTPFIMTNATRVFTSSSRSGSTMEKASLKTVM